MGTWRGHSVHKLVRVCHHSRQLAVSCALVEMSPFTKSRRSLAIILVVDLSLPEELLVTTETLLDGAKEKIQSFLNKTDNYLLKETMRQNALKRVGAEHEDIQEMNPFQVPLLIVGAKYDLYQVLRAMWNLCLPCLSLERNLILKRRSI